MSDKRPNVIFENPAIVVGSIKEIKGFLSGSRWEVRFGPRNNPTAQFIKLSTNTTGGNVGKDRYKVVWS